MPDSIIKVLAVSAVGSALYLVIRRDSRDMALLLTLSVTAFMLLLGLNMAGAVIRFVNRLGDSAGLQGAAVSIVLKEIGISIVSRVSSDICREAGQVSAASSAEFVGAIAALYVALPLFETVVSMIESLIA
ncbi:MAG: stage III sporulation AC/AD family protein [Oscillospiraceae bacterium]|jgi:stage III sporulation protein AD|nr:stage III sporulation AC/AD family protein [Oscillospiraceae bacterium]